MGKGRAPCCDKSKVKKGPWSPAEDLRLTTFIQKHGHSNWRSLPNQAGLLRCGKSCRLRWINYLRPDVKRGNFTPQEEQTIINLHNSIGNKWSKIASYFPGRTDNEIKNVWNTHLKKRLAKKSNNNINYSTSPSFTSSSITTSDDQNTSENPEFLKKISTAHPSDDHNEAKENSVFDSPTSSYASSFSNPIQEDKTPNEALGFSRPGIINPGAYNPDDGKIEIPLLEGDDIDLWEVLDSLEILQADKCEHNQGSNNLSNPGEEIECSKWLRVLENELGLASDFDNPPKEMMNFEQEISPGLDYFPMWPSSPQNLSM
ncbi:hypothetical protein BUALT_Bualt18G0084900 [Buddleja alternifolia]|uniref:Uncharacterized protein n=1 Tax=Buddleja alternifolia TaxID=168488 RepID=A0AAV6WD76_9LAMI|nr:hypothetical protein BUALT_Bualt18G0084900 [Buddleja alternifolia]